MPELGDRAFIYARDELMPHANHCVFDSNEADVLREMNAFIDGLK